MNQGSPHHSIPQKESLFSRIRRRLYRNKKLNHATGVINLSQTRHISRSMGTLVKDEDLDDRHSVNTSTLESENIPVSNHYRKVNNIHSRSFTELSQQNSPASFSKDINERKRLIHILSTQGISLLKTLDTELKRKESDNARLKKENRYLLERIQSGVSADNLRANFPEKSVQFSKVTEQLNKNAQILQDKIEQSSSFSEQVTELLSQNNKLSKDLSTALREKKNAQHEVEQLRKYAGELQSKGSNFLDEDVRSRLDEAQRDKESMERTYKRELKEAKEELRRLTSELSKSNALLNESKRDHQQLTEKYDALVLKNADLLRNSKVQSAAYQELQKRVAEMSDEQMTNDSILQATIQMAKRADKERRKIHGIVENAGKIYETYFNEFESDAQALRARLKTTKEHLSRNKKVYDNLLAEERAKHNDRIRAKDEELAYLRAMVGNRDNDASRIYGNYSTATELLGMSFMMQQQQKTPPK